LIVIQLLIFFFVRTINKNNQQKQIKNKNLVINFCSLKQEDFPTIDIDKLDIHYTIMNIKSHYYG